MLSSRLDLHDPLHLLLGRLLLAVVQLFTMLLQLDSPHCPVFLFRGTFPALASIKQHLTACPDVACLASFHETVPQDACHFFGLMGGFHLFLYPLETKVCFRISFLHHLLLELCLASSFNSLHPAHPRRVCILWTCLSSS